MAYFGFRQGLIPGADFATTQAKTLGPLAPFDIIGFTQFRAQRPLREFAASPQVYIYAAQQIAGIGGLVQGNMVFSPLGKNAGS